MNLSYDDLINRMGFFRDRANLSAREVSLQLEYTEQFLARIQNKTVELKVSTLLKFFDIVGITPQDFFYLGKAFSPEHKNVIEMFSALSPEGQATIVDLMKKIK